MIKIPGDRTVYMDVDDTLIKWGSAAGIPGWSPIFGTSFWKYDRHVEQLKEHYSRGQTVIIWSAGGVAWIEKAVTLLGLQNHVTAIMSKPTWSFDDLSAEEFMPKSRFLKPDSTEEK